MEHTIYQFYPGQEIITDWRYKSTVVSVLEDTYNDDFKVKLIVYKDWNQYKKRYDYHIAREFEVSGAMDLIRRCFESDGYECPHKSWLKIIKKYKVAFKYEYDKDGNIKILENEQEGK